MGVVYLASDPVLNRQVAVKTVDLSVEDPQEREFLRSRLLRDARAAAVLKHPNIVSVYDVFEEGGRAYLVMEYVEGDSLAARLKNNPLPDEFALLKVVREMADALDYTHARGVIHRDIKPANVMIDPSGATKIMDFGIARISDTRTVTPTGMVMGTVEYMAPEQILGEPVDGRADQFALAVVAYQMMTGSTLFGPHPVATLTYKIVNEAPPLPSMRNAALPRGVDAVLAKALAKKPAARFMTCGEFAAALARAFAIGTAGPLVPRSAAIPVPAREATVTLPTRATVAPAPSSHGPMLAAALAVLVLGCALAAVIWKPWNRTPQPPVAAVAEVAKPPAPSVAPPVRTKKTAEKPAASETKTEPGPEKEVKSEPPQSEPPESVSPVSKSTPPATSAQPSKPAPVPEPVPEIEPEALPPEPKNAAPLPFTLAMQQGEQQVKANDYPGAIQSFAKAISLRPAAPRAYYNRAAAYQHLQQFDLAMRDFSEAQRLDPKMVGAYISLAGCLVHEHHDPEALVQFQRALELKPDAVLALTGRGNIYLRRKQYGPALADFDKALRINAHYGPALLSRAQAREAIGDLAGAAEDRRSAAALHK